MDVATTANGVPIGEWEGNENHRLSIRFKMRLYGGRSMVAWQMCWLHVYVIVTDDKVFNGQMDLWRICSKNVLDLYLKVIDENGNSGSDSFNWNNLQRSKICLNVLFSPLTGKTRTKEKYRVVYTDHQRLELEKEFHCNRYITIRRKSELAVNLGLSERQVCQKYIQRVSYNHFNRLRF